MKTKRIVECLRRCEKITGRADCVGCDYLYFWGLDCYHVLKKDARKRLEELESKKENLIDHNADLNNRLNKAESHIEKLEKQLSEKQLEPEWISVEDRLPEKNGRYLVYNQKIIYITYYEAGNFLFKDITHWMPLPELPKPKEPKEPTFKDKFLEAFPKATILNPAVTIDCCAVFPWLLDEKGFCQMDMTCEECWNQPYFEEEGGE